MVYVFLANGFEEIEALTVVDILRRADIAVTTVSINEDTLVIGAHGIKVIADKLSNEISDTFSAIVLPGGMPGTVNLEVNDVVNRYINLAKEESKLICAICAAPSILGKMGLLDGKNATCYPGFENHLKGAKCKNKGVVCDGNIITSMAMGSAVDFALAIVGRLTSEAKAKVIKKQICY